MKKFKVYNVNITLKNTIKIILFFLILSILLVFSKSNFESVKESTTLFLSSIIPSLFPFILFSEVILKSDIINVLSNTFGNIITKVFNVSKPCTTAIIIGFLCGYPMGAKAVLSLYNENKITVLEAKKLLAFINNCNPVFIISTIGIGIFNNIQLGIIQLMSHFISAIIIAIFVTRIKHTSIILQKQSISNTYIKNNYNLSFFEIIKSSILKSFLTLANIFGFIILFNLSFSIFENFLSFFNVNQNIIAFLSGIFEITKGCFNIYETNLSYIIKICTISFLLGFSGLCILFQVYSVISNEKFKFKDIFIPKLYHGLISSTITYILIKITNISNELNLQVFSNTANELSYDNILRNIKYSYTISTFSIIIFLLIFNFIYSKKARKKEKQLKKTI